MMNFFNLTLQLSNTLLAWPSSLTKPGLVGGGARAQTVLAVLAVGPVAVLTRPAEL